LRKFSSSMESKKPLELSRPSTTFGNISDPAKWKQFEQRYWKELNARPAAVALLRQKIKQGTVTLVYAAHDEEHNGALALKEFLEHGKG